MTPLYDPDARKLYGDLPVGMTAWEMHTRQLAERAVRLQDERAERIARQNGERQRPSDMIRSGGRVVSPFQALVDAVRDRKDSDGDGKKGLLARIFGF